MLTRVVLQDITQFVLPEYQEKFGGVNGLLE